MLRQFKRRTELSGEQRALKTKRALPPVVAKRPPAPTTVPSYTAACVAAGSWVLVQGGGFPGSAVLVRARPWERIPQAIQREQKIALVPPTPVGAPLCF
jgi:hypothetical protein